MSRWKVQNIEYAWGECNPARLRRTAYEEDKPWEAYTPHPDFKFETFATHAEAITYADKQARRTA